jgi:hypothetical protein
MEGDSVHLPVIEKKPALPSLHLAASEAPVAIVLQDLNRDSG